MLGSFRPLAGISCIRNTDGYTVIIGQFPSPRGDKLHLFPLSVFLPSVMCFRPLAGISCISAMLKVCWVKLWFPSPRGDKLHLFAQENPLAPRCVSVPSRG